MATVTSTPEFVDLANSDNPFPSLDGFTLDNLAALENASGQNWTLSNLSASNIGFTSGTYGLTITGSGIGPVSSLSQLLSALEAGLANGALNQISLTDNGSEILRITTSGTQYTIVSGNQTLVLDGTLPASLDEIGGLISAVVALEDAESTSEENAAFNGILNLIDNYDLTDVSLSDGGTELLGVSISDNQLGLRIEGYDITVDGTFPDGSELLSYLYDSFGGSEELTVTLYDALGNEVQSTEASGGFGFISFQPPVSGTYYFGVSGSSNAGIDYRIQLIDNLTYWLGSQSTDTQEGADAPGDTSTNYLLDPNQLALGLLEPSTDDDWYQVSLDPGYSSSIYGRYFFYTYADFLEPDVDLNDIPGLSITGLTVRNPGDQVIAQISGVTDLDDFETSLDSLDSILTSLDFSAVAPGAMQAGVTADILTGTVTEPGNPAYTVATSVRNIVGSSGIDNFTGNALDNELVGGAGADTINGGDGADMLFGEEGADQLFGNAGDDQLYGGIANDDLFGGSGNDNLFGGTSTDRLYGGSGADNMDGGDNSDQFFVDGYDTVNDTGTVGYDKATIVNAAGEVLSLSGWSGVERINGNVGNDTIDGSSQSATLLLFGNDGNDILIGGAANDVLIGGAGDDQLFGNDGNDVLLGNGGNDTFDGGAGNDTFFVSDPGDVVSDGGAGFDRVKVTDAAGISLNMGSWLNVERVSGLTGDDTLDATGMATSITLVGGAGNDTLTGGSAGDVFYGGTGNDILNGAGGADALIGSVGADEIDGGAGNDFYLGGADIDTFKWTDGFGRDVVRDWTDGVDRLDFTGHSGVNALADLTIQQKGQHTEITLAAGGLDKITLAFTTATDVTGSDFDFV